MDPSCLDPDSKISTKLCFLNSLNGSCQKIVIVNCQFVHHFRFSKNSLDPGSCSVIFVMDLTPSSMGIQPDPTMQPFKARGHEVTGGGGDLPTRAITSQLSVYYMYCTQCTVQ